MKKRIEWLVVIVISVSLSCSSALAGSFVYELYDDFDSYSTGSTPCPPWQCSIDPCVVVEIDDTVFVGATGKSLHFSDPGGGIKATLSRTLTQKTSVVLEYYMRTDNENHEGAFGRLDGDGGSDYAVCFSNGASGGSAGYIGVHGTNGGWIVPELMAYSTNTWYYVRRELNCASNTGYFYVQEVDNPSNNASYTVGSNYVNSYVDKVSMYTSTSEGADCYIDQVAVITDYKWQTYNGHKYAITLGIGDWEQIEAEAEAVGGYLVTINDTGEHGWLGSTFYEPVRHDYLWIGFYQDHGDPCYSEPAGGWKWISGEAVTYVGWDPPEPTNHSPGEDYGVMTASVTNHWNDWDPDSSDYHPIHGIIEVTPWIVVMTPNGGEDEELISENTHNVSWDGWAMIDSVSLEYSDANGVGWTSIDPNTANDGSYDWNVPQALSSQCLVRISDADDPNIYDISDDVFTIYQCQLSSPADFNNDCYVELSDLAYFAFNWMRNGNPFDEKYTEAPEGMVVIPGGEFQMGDHHDGDPDELPVHAVYVDSFYMSRYEVTNQQYCDFLNTADVKVDGGIVYATSDSSNSYPYCDTTTSSGYSRITWSGSSFDVVSGKEDHPMMMVSWYGAVAYCNYYGYRLPTEAEWEYAARGGEYNPYYRYPWGDSIDGSKANYWSSGDPYETGGTVKTTPVGYYDGSQTPAGSDMANGYGLYDMIGNVYEWCNDWFSSSYYSVSPYDNPPGPASGTTLVIRGGSWSNDTTKSRVANRQGPYGPGITDHSIGFRVVLDLD